MADLTRRQLLRAGSAAVAASAIASVAWPAPASAGVPPGPWNHDPASKIGPFHWGDSGFPVCGTGTSQSPVNIATDGLAAYHGPPLPRPSSACTSGSAPSRTPSSTRSS